MPAFTPNPRKKSDEEHVARLGRGDAPASSAAKASEPERGRQQEEAGDQQPVPTWDMARYRYAARRLAALSCSVATSAAVASVISSHAKRNVITSPADEHQLHGAEQDVEGTPRTPCGRAAPHGADSRCCRPRTGPRGGRAPGGTTRRAGRPRNRTGSRRRRGAEHAVTTGPSEHDRRDDARNERERGRKPPTGTRQAPRRSASASATAARERRTRAGAGSDSAPPPEQQHEAHHERDHVGEVGVEAARLQHLHAPAARSIRESADRKRSVERRLDVGAVSHLRGKYGETSRAPTSRVGREIAREDHHQRLRERRRRILGLARRARRRIPTSARAVAAKTARAATPQPGREHAAAREAAGRQTRSNGPARGPSPTAPRQPRTGRGRAAARRHAREHLDHDREETQAHAEEAEKKLAARASATGTLSPRPRPAARQRQERDPERLHEAGRGQRARQRQQRPADRKQQPRDGWTHGSRAGATGTSATRSQSR